MNARRIGLTGRAQLFVLAVGIGMAAPAAASVAGEPWFNLAPGRAVAASSRGGSGAAAECVQPLSLAAADLDEDGVPDLVVGCAGVTGGVLVAYRGNVDAIYPHSPGAQRRRAQGDFGAEPFLGPLVVVPVPEPVELVGAGDFDADGHLDVVAGRRGGDSLHLLRGNGAGQLAAVERISLAGPVTALITGEVNRRDGLADVAVAVGGVGTRLLVFQDRSGAFSAAPETVALPGEAVGLALGQLDDHFAIDIVAAVGHGVVVVHGRDRSSRAAASSAMTDITEVSFVVTGLAVGNFLWEEGERSEIALLSDAGEVHLLRRDGDNDLQVSLLPQATGVATVDGAGGGAALVAGKVSSLPTDQLVVLDAASRRLVAVVTDGVVSVQPDAPGPPAPAALEADGRSRSGSVGPDMAPAAVARLSPVPAPTVLADGSRPLAVLPMRLSSDALDDLVVLEWGRGEPEVLKTVARATFTVTSTADTDDGTCDADCTLREAITAANASAGADDIAFDIPGPTPHTIQVLTDLPTVTDPVTIDGTTQPGFAGTPVVELDGSVTTGPGGSALAISAGSSTVRGLAINRFATNSDIAVWVNGGDIIEGNFLGTDVLGTSDLGTGDGINVFGIAGTTIGGTTAAARNLISGIEYPGIAVQAGATNTEIQGNYIGTDASGGQALGNSGNDVFINDSPGNSVGGTATGAGNVISGGLDPTAPSVGVAFAASQGNLVQGNLMGTDASGATGLGVASFVVYVVDAASNTVGGVVGNVVADSGAKGVGVVSAGATGNLVEGNLIGTAADGTTPLGNAEDGVYVYSGAGDTTVTGNTIANNGGNGVALRDDAGVGNTIAGNSIVANSLLGIDLGEDGVTANDPLDGDTGANDLQNFPVLTSVVVGSSTTVGGTLDSTPDATFTVDLYSSPQCDPSGHGEGEVYLGADSVVTDAGGSASFSITVAPTVAAGHFVTATATAADGSTSELSACIVVAAEADLAIAVSDSPDPAIAGGSLAYTVDVVNLGPDAATGVTVTDTLPPEVSLLSAPPSCTPSGSVVTCTLSDLSSGGSDQVVLQVLVDPLAAGTISNSVAVTAIESDPVPGNNTAVEDTLVLESLFVDGFESGDTGAWSATLP